MKGITLYTGFVLSVLLLFNCCTRAEDFPVLKGPYLGQKPPGKTAEIFAPGIISNMDSRDLISTDLYLKMENTKKYKIWGM